VAFHPPHVETVPLADIVGRTKLVPSDGDVVRTARAVGIGFGDQ
jgi:ATP-dependent phosphofructokinase / diphosphate-dependent phosphofructokinase